MPEGQVGRQGLVYVPGKLAIGLGGQPLPQGGQPRLQILWGQGPQAHKPTLKQEDIDGLNWFGAGAIALPVMQGFIEARQADHGARASLADLGQGGQAQGKTGMDPATVAEFVDYFWRALPPPLFIPPLTQPGGGVDLVIEVDRERRPQAIYHPGEGRDGCLQ